MQTLHLRQKRRGQGIKVHRQGGRAEIQLAGHKSPFLPLQQEKGTIPYRACITHPICQHKHKSSPAPSSRLPWVSKEVALGSCASLGSPYTWSLSLPALPAPYLVPATQFPGYPDLQPSSWLILVASRIYNLWFPNHKPPQPSWPSRYSGSHLQPGPNTRLPASPAGPPTGMQTRDCHLLCVPRWSERQEEPLRSHPRHSSSKTRARFHSCTYSGVRSTGKQGGWYPPCIEMCSRWSP